MKVQLVGTGAILTSYFSACALIDDQVMVDVPNGSMKRLRAMGVEPNTLDACLITHFHGDHVFDFPFLLLEQGLRGRRTSPIVVVGPQGIERRMRRLFVLAYPRIWRQLVAASMMEFVEANEDTPIHLDTGHVVQPVGVEHEGLDAYGYLVARDGRTVGFTGDTVLCEGVRHLARNADVLVADMAYASPGSGHMGLSDIRKLQAEYSAGPRIIPTHMTDSVRSAAAEYLSVPKDGGIFEV